LLGGLAVGATCGATFPLIKCSSPEKSFEVNAASAAGYLIPQTTRIYVNTNGTYFFAGHQLLDLKALSVDNDNVTNFVITGDVAFGFLVAPDMNCHLIGSGVDMVTCAAAGSNNAFGVIVGSTLQDSAIMYSKNLTIDPNVNFLVSSSGTGSSYGVYIDELATGTTEVINGTFIVKNTGSNTATGVCFSSINKNSVQIINGVFAINGASSYGVYVKLGSNGNMTINGCFAINQTSPTGYANGVYFGNCSENAIQTINGIFTLTCATTISDALVGVYFLSSGRTSTIYINGSFSFFMQSPSTRPIGVYLQSNNGGNLKIINGVFSFHSSVTY
jgi:hypothetical protein